MNGPDSIETAQRLHRSGKLAEAMKIYREELARQPANDRALHLLGVAESQCGNATVASDLIRRAIGISPAVANYYNSLAVALRNAGKNEEAIVECRRALQLRPDLVEAYINLGNALRDAGRMEESISASRDGIAIAPRNASLHRNLGAGLVAKGQVDDAVLAYRRSIELDPNDAAGFCDLSLVLCRAGQLGEAMSLCRSALGLKPDFAAAHSNMAQILFAQGNLEGAMAEYREVIRLDPGFHQAHSNLGVLLYLSGRFDDAAGAYRQALVLKPGDAEMYNNLGAALYMAGRLDESIEPLGKAMEINPNYIDAYTTLGAVLRQKLELDRSNEVHRAAIQRCPDSAEAHFGLAMNLLSQGRFAEGWPEYEWRRKRVNASGELRSDFKAQWDRSDLNGRTILLHAEQGAGDTIQFVRYVPMVAKRGGRVILVCPPNLTRVLSNIPGAERVIAAGEVVPAFDVHCPLLSLPLIFKTELATIPADVPYIRADGSLAESWRSRLADSASLPRVGLVWAGSPKQAKDRHRSMKFEQLMPLLGVPGIVFVSLQKGPLSKPAPPRGMDFRDYTDELSDFADTAALVENLDLVITVDTAVAHLAGAMGKPAWVLLSYSPAWSWMLGREDSPWYPTMRLFRQKSGGDWGQIVECVREDLSSWTAKRSGPAE